MGRTVLLFISKQISDCWCCDYRRIYLNAFLASYLTPYTIDRPDAAARLMPPSGDHWFGTDDLGRDVFTRVAYGARISLLIGLFAISGALIFGTFLGLVAGYYGRWLDMIISRIFDVMLAFPSILLAIAIVAILGPSLENAMLAIAIINVPIFGRIVRSKVISLRSEEFIMAAKAQGMKMEEYYSIIFFQTVWRQSSYKEH